MPSTNPPPTICTLFHVYGSAAGRLPCAMRLATAASTPTGAARNFRFANISFYCRADPGVRGVGWVALRMRDVEVDAKPRRALVPIFARRFKYLQLAGSRPGGRPRTRASAPQNLGRRRFRC